MTKHEQAREYIVIPTKRSGSYTKMVYLKDATEAELSALSGSFLKAVAKEEMEYRSPKTKSEDTKPRKDEGTGGQD